MTLTRSEKEQIKALEDRLTAIEQQLSRIKNIVVGIMWGLIGGAVIFGFISIREFIQFLK